MDIKKIGLSIGTVALLYFLSLQFCLQGNCNVNQFRDITTNYSDDNLTIYVNVANKTMFSANITNAAVRNNSVYLRDCGTRNGFLECELIYNVTFNFNYSIKASNFTGILVPHVAFKELWVYNQHNETINKTIWDERTVKVIGFVNESAQPDFVEKYAAGYKTEYRLIGEWTPMTSGDLNFRKGESKLVAFRFSRDNPDAIVDLKASIFGVPFNRHAWWINNTLTKVQINITETSGFAQSNFAVRMNVSWNPQMNANFTNVHFTNGSENYELPNCIASKVDSSHAFFDVNVSYLAASANTSIYMYYGTDSFENGQDCSHTYLYYDDFTTDKFSYRGTDFFVDTTSNTLNWSNDRGTANDTATVALAFGADENYSMNYFVNMTSGSGNGCMNIGATSTSYQWTDSLNAIGHRDQPQSAPRLILQKREGGTDTDANYNNYEVFKTGYNVTTKKINKNLSSNISFPNGTVRFLDSIAITTLVPYSYFYVGDYDSAPGVGYTTAGYIKNVVIRKEAASLPIVFFGSQINKSSPITTINSSQSAWFKSDQTVAVNGTYGAGIAYTTCWLGNGTVTNNTIFTITTQANNTIVCFSQGSDGEIELNKTFYLALDKTAPVTAQNGSATWYRANTGIGLTVTETLSGTLYTTYKNGAGAYTNGTTILVTTEANNTMKMFSQDVAGNLEVEQTFYIALDKTAPVTTINTSQSIWYTSDQMVAVNGTDSTSNVAFTTCWLGNGTVTNNTLFVISTQANNTIKCQSMDNAGNLEANKTFYLALDKVAPVTTTNITDSWYRVAVLPIALNGTDAVSQVFFTQHWNGGVSNATIFSINIQGNNTYVFYSQDKAGNKEANKTRYAALDNVAPVTTINTSQSIWYSGNQMVAVNGTDGTSGVFFTTCWLNGAAGSNNTLILVTNSANNTLKCQTTDVAGNQEANKTYYIAIDKSLPITTINTSQSVWYKSNQMVAVNATDAIPILYTTCYLGNGTVTNNTLFMITTEANNTIKCFSQDTAGNIEANKTFYLALDKTAPVTTCNATGLGVVPPVVVGLNGTDSVSQVAFTQHTINGVNLSNNTVFSFTNSGNFTINYSSVDVAGNVEASKLCYAVVAVGSILFQIYNGTGWSDYSGSALNFTNCTVNTYCNSTAQNITLGRPAFNITNNGTLIGVVQIRVNETKPFLNVACSNTTSTANAINLTSVPKNISSVLALNQSVSVWCWLFLKSVPTDTRPFGIRGRLS